MKNFSDKKIYLVTDHRIEFEELMEKVEIALKSGIRLVQYRDKDISTKLMCERAERLYKLCLKYDAVFLVNDRIDVALAIDCDGVHIGQDDMECSIARKILGNEKIIGVSSKTLEQSNKALQDGADYLGCGALFSTSTKDTSVIDLDTLKKIKENINIPIYAIGGINEKNITEEIKQHIDGVAVITAILNSKDINKTIKEFEKTLL